MGITLQRNRSHNNTDPSFSERRFNSPGAFTQRMSRRGFLKYLLALVLAINLGVVLSHYLYLMSGPLETTTIRELAFVRERHIGDGRAVYVTLYEYYHASTLIITEEALAYVGPDRMTAARYGRFATVEVLPKGSEFGGFGGADDRLVEIRFGLDSNKKALLRKGEEGKNNDTIIGFMMEDHVVFVTEN